MAPEARARCHTSARAADSSHRNAGIRLSSSDDDAIVAKSGQEHCGGSLAVNDAPGRKCLAEETVMQFVLVLIGASAAVFAALTTPRPERSDSVLVRAVLDGDTIDVTTLGRVRLLGIDAPEIGRGFDTAAPFAYAARDKLAGLVL